MKQKDKYNDNAVRAGLKDIWNAYLVEGAEFVEQSIPYSPTTAENLPARVIKWSEAVKSEGDQDSWVSFYELEANFDGPNGIWKHPEKCLEVVSRFGGCIVPDFSKSLMLPEPVRLWNVYRSHALAFWLGRNGINVINSAWYSPSCGSQDFSAMDMNSTVAIDTSLINIENRLERWDLERTVSMVKDYLQPDNVIVNGPVYRCIREVLGSGVGIFHINPETGKLEEEVQSVHVPVLASIDYRAPLIPGKSLGGIELESERACLHELIEADDVELIRCDLNSYCYEISGRLQLWFARSNDRLFQIGIKSGYEGKVLEYDDIWSVKEKDFLKAHGSEFEWLEDSEVYESKSLGMDIAFDNDDDTASWVAVLIEPVMGDVLEQDLSDWNVGDREASESWKSVTSVDYFTEGAEWDRGFPVCPTTADELPSDIVTWSVAKGRHGLEHKDAFVCFYEDDWKFDGPNGIWENPEHALEVLSNFRGVLVPDFSTHSDFPDAIKQYNTYRMRAFGFWLGKHGLRVINNVRWGDEDTWWYSFAGIEHHSTIAIGTLGGGPIRRENSKRFIEGLDELVEELEPETVIIYGGSSHECFKSLKEKGIKLVCFDSQTAKAHGTGPKR